MESTSARCGQTKNLAKDSLAVDSSTHEIVAAVTTESPTDGSAAVEPLLNQISNEVKSFRGDGAYDNHKTYNRLSDQGVDAIIPPRRNAVAKVKDPNAENLSPRDCAIHTINNAGSKFWKEQTNYHQRSLAETAMYRLKNTLGEKLKIESLKTKSPKSRSSVRC